MAALAPAWAAAQTVGDDPFESFNRRSFAFSIRLDHYVVGPVAKLSTGLLPGPLARAVHNIIVNLSEPQVILNCILQLRPQKAVEAATRLGVNSTFGLAGVFDVAGAAGIRHEPNGFGDTLGRYGVKSGPYLYIPVLGPSDFRDMAGAVADQFSSPLVYIKFPYRTPITISLALAGGLSQRAEAGPELDALLSSAADPYATLRSTYLQAREAEIRGQTALPPLPDIEGPSEAVPTTDTATQAAPPDSPPAVSPEPGPKPAPARPDAPPAPQTAGPRDAPSPAPPPSPAMP
jgi:phospholipid-binding lipoprotein MlaA